MTTLTVPEKTLPQPAVPLSGAPISMTQRLTSLDAYRGFVMFLMMAEVLKLYLVAEALPHNAFWQFLAHHQSHVPWVGCTLHDMIQPSFSFIVGVALPFSLASRLARGQSRGMLVLHAFWRALLLIALGIFLRSIGKDQTYYTFEDTLTQIGLGYGFLFLLGFRPQRDQWIAAALLLIGYWAFFALYPLPDANFDWAKAGVTADWPQNLQGLAAHWNKNTNAAWAFDTWFLNLLPRENPFTNNDGGYSTLSFIPTLATMILGLIAGGVLRSDRTRTRKVLWLAVAGVIALAAGWLLDYFGVCPIVKRIWTPSWTLFSGGICLLALAGSYLVIDVWGWKAWTFPLVVIGMNSIAAYCIAHLFESFLHGAFMTHLGADAFKKLGVEYEALLMGACILLVYWLILFWMYRRRLFLRI
jgi:heparan-alpha-glucosaminide N-acetyltransferase